MVHLPLPFIDQIRCTGCHLCVDICPAGALVQSGDKARLAYPNRCTYCAVCEDQCPENAISLPYRIVFASPRPKSAPRPSAGKGAEPK